MLLLYCGLGLKLGLVVRKRLASLGMGMSWKLDGALTPRASLRLKVTWIGTAMVFFPLVTLALSGPEKALILVW